MGVLRIFDGCSGDILFVSWRYLMGVLEIFGWYPVDISWVTWRY